MTECPCSPHPWFTSYSRGKDASDSNDTAPGRAKEG